MDAVEKRFNGCRTIYDVITPPLILMIKLFTMPIKSHFIACKVNDHDLMF